MSEASFFKPRHTASWLGPTVCLSHTPSMPSGAHAHTHRACAHSREGAHLLPAVQAQSRLA